MPDDIQKKIFSKNLLDLLDSREKSQKEVASAIGVSPQTFNTWCQGVAIPRMGKVQLLADYFHIKKSDLIEPKPAASSPGSLCDYYDRLIQFLDSFPEYRQLVSDAVHVRPEDIDFASQCLERLADPESSAPDLPDSARSGLTAEALALVRDTPEVLAAEAEYIKSRLKQQSKPERSASTSTGGANRKSS